MHDPDMPWWLEVLVVALLVGTAVCTLASCATTQQHTAIDPVSGEKRTYELYSDWGVIWHYIFKQP